MSQFQLVNKQLSNVTKKEDLKEDKWVFNTFEGGSVRAQIFFSLLWTPFQDKPLHACQPKGFHQRRAWRGFLHGGMCGSIINMDNYFMELEGLTLASFFQPKEKCTTLKCIKYNTRKNQVSGKILPTFKQILTSFSSRCPWCPRSRFCSSSASFSSFSASCFVRKEHVSSRKVSILQDFFGIFVILSDSFKIRTL